MTVQLLDYTKSKIPKKRLHKLILHLFKHFSKNAIVKKKKSKVPSIEDLSIVFVTPAKSQWLNKKFRKKNYPTDVLSFAPTENHMGLGELVLCPQVLKRQAKENGWSVEKEIDLMLIHGFLHLLGFDHEKSLKEERRMMKIQGKLLEKYSP